MDLHLNGRKTLQLVYCGDEIVKKMEDSHFIGLQRKCDYSVRTSPNSICQEALPFCLSINLSLRFEH